MNPLDNEEFTKLLQIIKNDMPKHTDTTATIKRSFSQGMPKHLMEYSREIDNEFLNNNLAVIEEINHRDSKHWLSNWFKQYQNKIYGDSEILNHDNFFKATLHGTWKDCYEKGISFPKISGGGNHGNAFLSFTLGVAGATIETNDGSGGSGASRGVGQIDLAKFPNTGVVSELYDRLAYHGNDTTGNIEMGVYAEDTPNARLVVTGSIAAETSYAWHNVTEFSLTHTQNWFAWNNDAGAQWYYKTDTTKTKAVTFGSMPNPAGGGYSDTTTEIQGKMGHT